MAQSKNKCNGFPRNQQVKAGETKLKYDSNTFDLELDELCPVFYHCHKDWTVDNQDKNRFRHYFDICCFDFQKYTIEKRRVVIEHDASITLHALYDQINKTQWHTADRILRIWWSTKTSSDEGHVGDPYFDRFLKFCPYRKDRYEWLTDIVQNWFDYTSECEWSYVSRIETLESLFMWMTRPSNTTSFLMQAHGFDERWKFLSVESNARKMDTPIVRVHLRFRPYHDDNESVSKFKEKTSKYFNARSQATRALKDFIQMAYQDPSWAGAWIDAPFKPKTFKHAKFIGCVISTNHIVTVRFELPPDEVFWNDLSAYRMAYMDEGRKFSYTVPDTICKQRSDLLFFEYDLQDYPEPLPDEPSELRYIARVFPYTLERGDGKIQKYTPYPILCKGITKEQFLDELAEYSFECLFKVFGIRSYHHLFSTEKILAYDMGLYTLKGDALKKHIREKLYPDIIRSLHRCFTGAGIIEEWVERHRVVYEGFDRPERQHVREHLYAAEIEVGRYYGNPSTSNFDFVSMLISVTNSKAIPKYASISDDRLRKRAIMKDYHKEVIQFAIDVLEGQKKFTRYGVPATVLSVDDYTITEFGDVVLKFGYKKELLKAASEG